jgi:hypothetical protein
MSLHAQAQSIIAGQASGANIIYHDIEDVYLSSSYWWDESNESMDLNDDGVTDLKLLTNWVYFSHPYYEFIVAESNPLGGLEYSSLSDNPTWIKKHNAGEVIDNSLNWHAENGLFFSQTSDKSTAGNFSDEGYLAYRICYPDTIYGWLRIKCNVSFSGAYLTAYEYAYLINITGLPADREISLDRIIRKSGNNLLVNLPENQFPRPCRLYGFDVTGRQIFQFDLKSGSHCLNIFGYPHGLYLLRLTDIHGQTFSGKMIF